jgi:acetolactate synthase-1/2/3 large subunit
MNTKVRADPAFWAPHQYRRTAPSVPAPELVERATDMLIAAEQPLIHAGSGIIHAAAYAELRQVAERLGAPVTTSWSARGVLPNLPSCRCR